MEIKHKSAALSFVILIGVVSLFSDMTHEGARSIYGAYLALAGASAAAIGFVSGLGEFIGYSFRLLTGYIADRTHRYWTVSIVGYGINMFAVPLIALVPQNGWKYACALIVLERVGKAIRHPAKNTMVSFASSQVGHGKAFALQEFMDQIGAFCGPLMLFVIVALRKGYSDLFSTYQLCFAALIIPAVLTMFFLLRAKHRFPHPENLEVSNEVNSRTKFSRSFIIYIIAINLFAFGFIDFPLITMHMSKHALFGASYLPLLYAGAMLVDAFAALLFGWMYDRFGLRVLIAPTILSAFFAPLIFLMNSQSALLFGIALWGIGMGAQESVMKSAVASLVSKQNRSTGFGVFETSFGIFWFLGSWLMGLLYDQSIGLMVAVSVGAQLLSIPLLTMIRPVRK